MNSCITEIFKNVLFPPFILTPFALFMTVGEILGFLLECQVHGLKVSGSGAIPYRKVDEEVAIWSS